jgi:hypothetical protein
MTELLKTLLDKIHEKRKDSSKYVILNADIAFHLKCYLQADNKDTAYFEDLRIISSFDVSKKEIILV